MQRLRTNTLVLLFCLIALISSGCALGGPPTTSSPADATAQPSPAAEGQSSVTITFGAMSFMRHTYEPLIATFNAQHPGIIVQFVSLDDAYQASTPQEQTRQIVSRADTAEAGVNKEEFDLGLLRDLKPLMDADRDFNPDDFYPTALSSATSASGAVYKLPQTLDVPLLFYNKDLWAARGLAAPKPDWTWQDLTAAAQQLAEKQGSSVKVYGLADQDTYLAVLLAELKDVGLDLTSTPPGSARVDRPEVVAALERMASLFDSGAFFYPPERSSDFRDAVAQLIVDRQIAMWGSRSAGDLAELQKRNGGTAAPFALGVATYPPFPSGAPDFAQGYVMSSGTQHPDEAWAWLSFLSKQIVSNADVKGGPPGIAGALPARKSLAEQSGYWSRLDEETRAAMQAALGRPAPALSSKNIPDAYEPLFQALLDIIDGKNATQAASEAQAAIANQVAQAQQTPTVAPNEPIVVATPAPNVAPAGATTITFGMPLAKGGGDAEKIVQQFNQSNQETFVQLKDTFTGNGFLSTAEAAAQSDCFTTPFPPAPSELTATLDLQPLIDADASFKLDDYPAALLTPYRQGEQLHGLPWGVEFRVLVYNKKLFDAAGLQPPSAEWTIDDFLDAAQKLTSGQGDDKQYGFVIPRATSQGVKSLINMTGAPLTLGSGDTLRPNFSDPKVLEAAQKVVDLLRHDTPHARLDDYAANGRLVDYGELTGEGRAGMWFAWGLYAYGREPEFAIAMAPPPLTQAILDGDDVSTSGMYISARSDKQQACWEWLKYFSAMTARGASNIPARRSAAQSDAINQAQPGMAAVYNAYAAALDRVGTLAPGGDSDATPPIDYYWFYQAIDRALQGKNLEQELTAAQALTERYVACVRAGGQRQACDQEVDPSYGQS